MTIFDGPEEKSLENIVGKGKNTSNTAFNVPEEKVFGKHSVVGKGKNTSNTTLTSLKKRYLENIVGKGKNTDDTTFDALKKRPLENIVEKGEKY